MESVASVHPHEITYLQKEVILLENTEKLYFRYYHHFLNNTSFYLWLSPYTLAQLLHQHSFLPERQS